MNGGYLLIDIISLLLFLIAISILLIAKLNDTTNLLRRKNKILSFLFLLVISSIILRYFILEFSILFFIFVLILTFKIFDLERKTRFNKRISLIKKSMLKGIINPKLNRIKLEQQELEKQKLQLEKEKEKLQQAQLKIEESREIGKQLEKEKEKLNKEFEKLKKLKARKPREK